MPGEKLASHPVDSVTWYQAVAFCRWLSASLPLASGARLPSEEEWEFACRAGTQTRYWTGDQEADLDRVGWFGDLGGTTHPVGERPANPWGLYDVPGNVWEWTSSGWTDDYSGREGGIEVDPSAAERPDVAVAAAGGGVRVIRGGSFAYGAVNARSAFRNGYDPVFEVRLQGFRVVLPRP